MNNMNIGFIGLGLIGGSIARSLKKINNKNYLIAYDYYCEKNNNSHNPRLLSAKKQGYVDKITCDLTSFKHCDIIYLCAPVKTNINYLIRLKNIVSDSCIITDVGSVKGDIHDAAIKNGMEHQFVGGHPMAGSEKTGFDNSNETLLENAYYIITSTVATDKDKVEMIYEITAKIGAIPVKADCNRHDEYVAAISHVPHVVAVSLVNMVRKNDSDGVMKLIAAGGFKDITRIGSSSPDMWENICLNNSECILKYLDYFMDNIKEAREYIANHQGKKINQMFLDSKNYRDSISNDSGRALTSFHELFVDVEDTKGIIARIATLLASDNINIKNIGIVNNREFDNGVLRIEFKDKDAKANAASVLEKENFTVYK